MNNKNPNKISNIQFKEKFILYYEKYNLDINDMEYSNSDTPVFFNCIKHGMQKRYPYHLFKNDLSPCKKCLKEQIGFRVTDTESFVKKSNIIHNNEFIYSKSKYNGNSSKITITCKAHGDFELIADEHINLNKKCPKCNREKITLNKDIILEQFNSIHLGKYNYPKFKYINGKQIIDIECTNHGIFQQKIEIHKLGHGCPKCGNEKINNEIFINNSIKKYGEKYDYSLVNYKNNKTKIEIICPKHGVFEALPTEHLRGRECLICNTDKNNIKYLSQFKEKANIIHNNKYNYSKSEYKGRFNNIKIICPEHGEFEQIVGVHLQGSGCPECANNQLNYSSKYESEIIEFIKSNSDIKIHPRFYLGKKEIDIYFPEQKWGIEFNGTYWHSHLFKDKKYHKEKLDHFNKNNINIFFIWEYDWVNPIKKSILKSMILNRLKLLSNKIYARNTKIRIVDSSAYKTFCEQNHIQGHSPANIKLGLYYGNELVSCMSFNKLRLNLGNKNNEENKDRYELVRFCNILNTNVIGGASKLLKHFETNYKIKSLVSYANNDYSQGKLYNVLGFENKGFTNITYNYFDPKQGKLYNRFKYRKSELIRLGYDRGKTEFEITHNMGLYRIYNSGTLKFLKEY